MVYIYIYIAVFLPKEKTGYIVVLPHSRVSSSRFRSDFIIICMVTPLDYKSMFVHPLIAYPYIQMYRLSFVLPINYFKETKNTPLKGYGADFGQKLFFGF